MAKSMRLDKLLGHCGWGTRRQLKELCKGGHVFVNGQCCRDSAAKVDPEGDQISVDGTTVVYEAFYYLMMNKPAGVLSATEDRCSRTVLDLLPQQYQGAGLFPVGRLDKDTTGLLLLTNDGDFANLLTHPSHGVSKLYRVTVRPHATEEQIIALTDGVVLDDGSKTLPAAIHVVTDEPERTVLEMTIREGKNRQIRRMCEAVGLDVIRLRRSALGAVKLGMLQPGQYRELTSQEVAALRTAASRGKATATIAKNTAANAARRTAAGPHGPRAPKGAVAARKKRGGNRG